MNLKNKVVMIKIAALFSQQKKYQMKKILICENMNFEFKKFETHKGF